MEAKNSDRIVFIKDLFFAVIYRWRAILIAVVVAGIALGAYSYTNQSKHVAATVPEQVQKEAIAAYEKEKAIIDQRISSLTTRLDSQSEYVTSAPIMQLNANALYRVFFDYTIHTDYQIQPDKSYQNVDPIHTVAHAYCTALTNEKLMTAVADAVGTSAKYASDLVAVSNNAATTRSFNITITVADAETAQALYNSTIQALEALKPQIAQTVAPHALELINATVREVADPAVADAQAAAMDRLDALKTSLADQQAAARKLVRPVFTSNAQPQLKKVAVFAVIGGILGAFVVAGCACLAHIAGDKVYSARTLYCGTDVKILGCIAAGKRFCVDRWLQKLEGRTVTQEHTAAVMANVRNYCANAKRVLVTGSCAEDAQMIALELKALGVDAESCGDLLSSAETLKVLPNFDAVLLVATCGHSRYSSVCKTLSCLKDMDIRLLGSVVVGG